MKTMNSDYIKMILALPDEFFEGWEWNDGDQVYLLEDVFIDEYTDTYKKGVYTVFDGWLARHYTRVERWIYVSWCVNNNKIRPIPDQERLQEMAINAETKAHPNTPSNDFDISELFIARVIEGCSDVVDDAEHKTLNVMWLEFTVNIILGKIWNGENWINDSI